MKRIYFNEYNLLMGSGGIVYLPYVSGILSAFIKTSEVVNRNCEVMPFLFRPASLDSIVGCYDDPFIAAFSISMWNEQLSLSVARDVKSRFPDCLVVFGGSQCPHDPTDYMKLNTFIDVCVRAEGEEAFLQIVESAIKGDRSFHNIPNVTYRRGREIIINLEKPDYDRSLDHYPSPYLTGEFEYLLSQNNHGLQAIVETNRGCPFLCTFCYWGRGGNTSKYRFRGLEVVYNELEYLSSKGVEYIFNADSNFGMHQRDYEIAKKLVELKTKSGFPEKFRTCWGKNTSERIFKIASLLQLHGLDKGITLARQSNSDEVLTNIKRENIKLESYEFLEKNFNRLQVPVYAELILGLPGETVESWKLGIDQMLNIGLNNQLFIYQAEVYPNTELGSPEYQQKYKIETTRIKLNEIHCSPRELGWIDEFQHIVTRTYSMSTDDWREMTTFSIMTMLLHSMKAGIYVLAYCHHEHNLKYSSLIDRVLSSKSPFMRKVRQIIDSYVDGLLAGQGRGLFVPEYSDVYLEVEEVLFLEISKNREVFFDELLGVFRPLIPSSHFDAFSEVVRFQRELFPIFNSEVISSRLAFDYNIPDYVYSIFGGEKVELQVGAQAAILLPVSYDSPYDFTRKRILWARKSGTILNQTDRERYLREQWKADFKIEDFSNEKSFKISMFDAKRKKFVKFSSTPIRLVS